MKICARVMALPESEVHTLLEEVRAEFGDRHPKIDEFLQRRFERGPPLSAQRPETLRRTEVVARRVFHPRVFARSRRVVQSLDRAAPGSVGPAARLTAFHPEPAGHGRRAHFLDHLSHRTAGRRQQHHDRRAHPLLPRADASAQRDVTRSACSSGSFRNSRLVGDFNRQVLNGLPDAFTLEELRASVSRAAKQVPGA